ncbi:MAG TPA: tetratricopeptide repeat protein [Vicinamibacterales bacterium]|nr:tetratricopeptide repeat protein [Vicinamibacterales bacterium]
MPLDREATLRQAERLKGQGRLDLAIAEYVRLVEEQPRDWNAVNALGDLYLRAGDADQAVVQFVQIADHLFAEGFFPKAAALYKKALKTRPDHEHTLLRLAEIAAAQELLADARAYLRRLWELRSEHGDDGGAAECLVRLAELPEADAETLLTGARASKVLGETARAVTLFRTAAEQLQKAGRSAAALDALSQVVALEPQDVALRGQLARQYFAAGQIEDAGRLLDAETAGTDPDLLLSLASIESARKDDAAARSTLTRFIAVAPDRAMDVLRLAGEAGRAGEPDRAFSYTGIVVDDAVLRGEWDRAIDVLQSFLVHGRHLAALLKLVQIAADAGQDDIVLEAREQLADAYLEAGLAAEAQSVAEALLAGAPDSTVHADRLRRALELAGSDDPDAGVRLVQQRFTVQPTAIAEHVAVDVSTPRPMDPDVSLHLESDLSMDMDMNMDMGVSMDVNEIVSMPVDENVAGFEVIPGIPSDGDAEDELELPTEPTPASRLAEDGPREIDLSEAISAIGSSARAPSSAAAPGGALSVSDAAVLFERGQQRLEKGQAFEGMADLEEAARVPAFRFQAASRLGREYLTRGHAHAAVEWLERAADVAAPSRDANLAVLYELGVALQRVGESARALAVFMELESEEPGFRDVGSRLTVLARVEDESRR